MDRSSEDALRLFNKWEIEASLITIFFRSREGGSSCVGVISALSSELIVISAPNRSNEPSGNAVHIYIDEIDRIDYGDSRNMDVQIKTVIDHILTIQFKSGATAVAYNNQELYS